MAEATGHPDAIIGGIVPSDPIADTERLLDEQMASPRFRGIRPMGGGDGRPERRGPAGARRARPRVRADGAPRRARGVGRRARRLGQPHRSSSSTPAGRGPTRPRSSRCGERGISALAALGDNVHCKLSGLAMPLHSMDARRAAARGSSTASSRSASTAACSRATSRSTRCTARSTSSTRASTGHRRPRRRRARQALRRQRRAALSLLSRRHGPRRAPFPG